MLRGPSLTLSDDLPEFLRLASVIPFTYGAWDCGRFVAQWVLLNRGIEPGKEYVGAYDTALQLARILKRRGGIVRHFDLCLAEIRVFRTQTPQRGDISIVDAVEGPTGAIMLNSAYSVCLSQNGIRIRCLPLMATWRI